MAQTFNRAFLVADYYINTESFAKDCENKAVVELKCKGKCQLMKKLAEEEKKDQRMPDRKLENKNEVISSKSFYAKAPAPVDVAKQSFAVLQPCLLPRGVNGDIFHPPA